MSTRLIVASLSIAFLAATAGLGDIRAAEGNLVPQAGKPLVLVLNCNVCKLCAVFPRLDAVLFSTAPFRELCKKVAVLTLSKEDPLSSRLLCEFGIQGGYKGIGPIVIVLDGHGERLDSFSVYSWTYAHGRDEPAPAPKIVGRINKALAYPDSIEQLERRWRRDVTHAEAFEAWSKRMIESEQHAKLYEACNALYDDPKLPESVRDAYAVQRQMIIHHQYHASTSMIVRRSTGEKYTTLDEILDGKTLLSDIGSRLSNHSAGDADPAFAVLNRLWNALATQIRFDDQSQEEIYKANPTIIRLTRTYPLGMDYFDERLQQRRKGQPQILLLTSHLSTLRNEVQDTGAFLNHADVYRELCRRANVFQFGIKAELQANSPREAIDDVRETGEDYYGQELCARLSIPRTKPWFVILDGHGERLDSFEADFPPGQATTKDFAEKIVARIDQGLPYAQSIQELEWRWRADASNTEAFESYARRMEQSGQQAALFRVCNAMYNDPDLPADLRQALAARRTQNRGYSALGGVYRESDAGGK